MTKNGSCFDKLQIIYVLFTAKMLRMCLHTFLGYFSAYTLLRHIFSEVVITKQFVVKTNLQINRSWKYWNVFSWLLVLFWYVRLCFPPNCRTHQVSPVVEITYYYRTGRCRCTVLFKMYTFTDQNVLKKEQNCQVIGSCCVCVHHLYLPVI